MLVCSRVLDREGDVDSSRDSIENEIHIVGSLLQLDIIPSLHRRPLDFGAFGVVRGVCTPCSLGNGVNFSCEFGGEMKAQLEEGVSLIEGEQFWLVSVRHRDAQESNSLDLTLKRVLSHDHNPEGYTNKFVVRGEVIQNDQAGGRFLVSLTPNYKSPLATHVWVGGYLQGAPENSFYDIEAELVGGDLILVDASLFAQRKTLKSARDGFVSSSSRFDMHGEVIESGNCCITFWWNHPCRAVYLVGEWDNWRHAVPMVKIKPKVFAVDLIIGEGSYKFKYLVDGEWAVDHFQPWVTSRGEVIAATKRSKDDTRLLSSGISVNLPECTGAGFTPNISTVSSSRIFDVAHLNEIDCDDLASSAPVGFDGYNIISVGKNGLATTTHLSQMLRICGGHVKELLGEDVIVPNEDLSARKGVLPINPENLDVSFVGLNDFCFERESESPAFEESHHKKDSSHAEKNESAENDEKRATKIIHAVIGEGNRCTVANLQIVLGKYGLRKNGKKSELMRNLIAYFNLQNTKV